MDNDVDFRKTNCANNLGGISSHELLGRSTRSHLAEGSQVRRFFEEDLRRIPPGFCFMPEWICHSMTQVAFRSHHTVLFYPVNSPGYSEIPLESNWKYLLCLIQKYAIYKKDIIVLMAFPLGYIDYKALALLNMYKQLEKLYFFLDLAQAYGSFHFSSILSQVEALYISFNGQKLIDSGGALRFSRSPPSSESAQIQFQKNVQAALKKQKESWAATRQTIQSYYYEEEAFKKALARYNHPSKRSSYHRTALFASAEATLSQTLVQEGFGQFIHPNPQKSRVEMSQAYEEWKNCTILLFPSKREKGAGENLS